MKKLMGMLLMGLTFSFNAMALGISHNCYSTPGQDFQWLRVTIGTFRVCPRCDNDYYEIKGYMDISVPTGPRGSYITQRYILKNVQHYRLNQSTYIRGGNYKEWFPSEVKIFEDQVQPIFIQFKGENFNLKCE